MADPSENVRCKSQIIVSLDATGFSFKKSSPNFLAHAPYKVERELLPARHVVGHGS